MSDHMSSMRSPPVLRKDSQQRQANPEASGPLVQRQRSLDESPRVIQLGTIQRMLNGSPESGIAGGGVVQRNPKDPLTAPGARHATEVPDLSAAIVAKLRAEVDNKAKSQATRGKALVELLATIGPTVAPKRHAQTVIRYDGAATKEFGAHALEIGTLRSVITIFEPAFENPSILYSTLRHELIHAEQFRPSADNPHGSVDYVYSFDEKKHSNQDMLMEALQEIETYSWEVIHADATGVPKDYIEERVTSLKDRIKTAEFWYEKVKRQKEPPAPAAAAAASAVVNPRAAKRRTVAEYARLVAHAQVQLAAALKVHAGGADAAESDDDDDASAATAASSIRSKATKPKKLKTHSTASKSESKHFAGGGGAPAYDAAGGAAGLLSPATASGGAAVAPKKATAASVKKTSGSGAGSTKKSTKKAADEAVKKRKHSVSPGPPGSPKTPAAKEEE